MRHKYYILRELDTDNFLQFKGHANTFGTNLRNVHVFKETSLAERLAHAERLSKQLNKRIVSEDWASI